MSISLVKEPTSQNFDLGKKPNPKKPGRGIGIKEPSGGLVPIGDTGLWITPDEPADPQDCERYPTSAWCTFDFFTLTPFSFEPSIAVDKCNIGIRLDASIGFIRVPPVSLVYRDPSDDCKLPPPPTPPLGDNEPVPFPINSCNDSVVSLIIYGVSSQHNIEEFTSAETGIYYYSESTSTNTVIDIEFPYEGEHSKYIDENGQVQYRYSALVIIKAETKHSYNLAWGKLRRRTRESDPLSYVEEHFNSILVTPEGYVSGVGVMSPYVSSELNYPISNVPDPYVNAVMQGLLGAKERLKNLTNYSEGYIIEGQNKNGDVVTEGYSFTQMKHFIIVKCGKEGYTINPPPPIEDNPPPRKCCMSCCPSHGEQDNSLLNLLIKKVDKLSDIVGVDEYPIKVPASLISKDEGFIGNLIPNENVKIPNLSTFLAWYIERFDEIMGQWEIPIEIKDSDPTKPGDQPVGIKLPNIAECMAEMFTLCFQTNINSEVLLNMCMRTLAETGTDKQQNFITYKLLQSLTDWVGYKQKDTVQPMPLSFTLNKTRYDEILKESEVNVPVPEFDEKFGLEADLMRFREAASILQANHKIKINPNGDVKEQILKYLVDTFANVNKVNGEDAEQDFEDFLEEVETGFINTRGVTNNTNPYGRPFNERPRIRDLTNFETDNPTP